MRDINPQGHRGAAVLEVWGTAARNGAGKSTLLKILSRITAPTEGRIRIKGRVGSLLEVGTGFHPELTGRENIYLNGTILGMTKPEVTRKLDEIVEFAEMAQFIDTPVKRYSSGMTVRLAFAVAAHLEPEILIIDEVLAVGDAAFQKKCLGKMQDVAGQGRTVLFVSHNMGMITSLCSRGALLDRGQLKGTGTAPEVVLSYFSRGGSAPHSADFRRGHKPIGDSLATLLHGHIEDIDGNQTGELDIRKPFRIIMTYELRQAVSVAPYPNFHFLDTRGEVAFVSCSKNYEGSSGTEPGVYVACCEVPAQLLNSETYFIGLALTFTQPTIHVSFFEKDALAISLVDPLDHTVDSIRCGYSGPMPGIVRPKLDWTIQRQA
jgi:lipopolysaccharide transport system ATP-binding protein